MKKLAFFGDVRFMGLLFFFIFSLSSFATDCIDPHLADDRQVQEVSQLLGKWDPRPEGVDRCVESIQPSFDYFRGRIGEFTRDNWEKVKSDHAALRKFLHAAGTSGLRGELPCKEYGPRSGTRVPNPLTASGLSRSPRTAISRGSIGTIFKDLTALDYFCKEGFAEMQTQGSLAAAEFQRRIEAAKKAKEGLGQTEKEFQKALSENLKMKLEPECLSVAKGLRAKAIELKKIRELMDTRIKEYAGRSSSVQHAAQNAATQRNACQSVKEQSATDRSN